MDDITTGRLAGLRLDRRSALRGGALAAGGIAAAVLIGCGGDDDEGDAGGGAEATGTAAASTIDEGDAQRGFFVKDDSLPYPFNFPEPKKDPKPGGTLRVAATWDVGPMDPTLSAAGGTVTVPNVVYNRLIGIKRGPTADPLKTELVPELAQSWERSPDGLTYPFKIGSQFVEASLHGYRGQYVITTDKDVSVANTTFLDWRAAASLVVYPQPLGFQVEYNIGEGPERDFAAKTVRKKSLNGGYAMMMLKLGDFTPYVRGLVYNGGKKHETNAPAYRNKEVEIGLEWLPWNAFELTAAYTYGERTHPKSNVQETGHLLRLQAQFNY